MLLATIGLVCVPAVAVGAVPVDPRITAAVRAWKIQPVYVDPEFASLADVQPMLEQIRSAKVPVYVAVVPTGEWFLEKDDPELLAGWLANANDKPGIYLVMDGYSTRGAEHRIAAYAPGSSWAKDPDQTMSSRLADYLADVRVDDRYDAKPARTTPYVPGPEPERKPERFTVGKAIGNGLGGAALGLTGGAILAGVVLGAAALVGGRRS